MSERMHVHVSGWSDVMIVSHSTGSTESRERDRAGEMKLTMLVPTFAASYKSLWIRASAKMTKC